MLTSTLMAANGRKWLMDCGFRGATSLSDLGTLVFVNRNYDGGLRSFITRQLNWTPELAVNALLSAYSPSIVAGLLQPHPFHLPAGEL